MGAFPLVFDGHNDTVLSMTSTGRSFLTRSSEGHIDLPRAREGGLGGGFFAVYIRDPQVKPLGTAGGLSTERVLDIYGDESTWPEPMPLDYAQSTAIEMLGRLLRVPQDANGAVRIVTTAADLQRALDENVFAILLHFEGAEPLDGDGQALEVFYAAGLRSVGLTHSRRNRFAKGVPFKFGATPDTGEGLNDAGKQLVKQLNRRRVMIDLSHLNEKGFWDVATISDAPLVATHSNAWALSRTPRNLTDKQMDAIKKSRGVAGLNFHVGFLREDGGRDAATPLSRMVDHIRYMVDRMGVECVALGSDFDGATMPNEVKDAAALPNLMRALQDAGFRGGDLQKIAHGNWVRVLRDTWGQ